MSSRESYYTQPSSPPAGPPPPPPPKPYSQDASRTGTPLTNPAPPPPPPHPSQSHYQQPPLPPHPSQTRSSTVPTPYSPPPPGQSIPQPPYQTHPTHPQEHNLQSPVNAPHPALQYHQQQQQQPPHLPNTIDLPSSIKSHTTADLSSLLSNPNLLTSLATQHPAYATALQPLQSQIASNLALAQQVSSLEAQVKAMREQTGQLMLQHTSLQTQWRRKQGEMDEALAPWGPRAMYQRLVAAIAEQEALLRAVYESFLEGANAGHEYYGDADGKATDKEVTDWIKRIREGTVVLEKRREMRARWDEGRVGGWR